MKRTRFVISLFLLIALLIMNACQSGAASEAATSVPPAIEAETQKALAVPPTATPRRQNRILFIGDSFIFGFDEDIAYFGWKSRLLGNIFAVPSWSTQLHSIENFRFLTLYFLLKERNVRWMSLWSPTFLLVVVE